MKPGTEEHMATANIYDLSLQSAVYVRRQAPDVQLPTRCWIFALSEREFWCIRDHGPGTLREDLMPFIERELERSGTPWRDVDHVFTEAVAGRLEIWVGVNVLTPEVVILTALAETPEVTD